MLNKSKEMERKIDIFGYQKIQDYITMTELFKKSGITFSDILSYKKRKEKKEVSLRNFYRQKQEKWQKKAPKCPLCTETLRLRAINILKGPQNLFGWESSWFCDSPQCAYEHYSEKTPEAQLAKYKLL